MTDKLSKRKKLYKCVRWGVFIVLCACLAAIMSVMCVTSALGKSVEIDYVSVRVIGTAYVMLTILQLGIGVLMVLALRTFVKVVQNSS